MERAGLSWLDPGELRIGLGCMRLSSGDEALANDTLAAAVRAGVTMFDTGHAYGPGERELGHNERLLAGALRRCGAELKARIATKGGMARAGGAWIPDGRAKAIRSDCEASLTALGGLAIDLYLIHAPDPRTPWRTSVRALARLLEDGLVRNVGLSNVNRPQLEEALELAPITAVQVPLSVYDDGAIRGGLLERCAELGIALIAHSPLGGPRRVRRLAADQALTRVAARHGATPAEVALAWVLGLSPVVVAIPGARHPEAARSAARAARLALDADDRAALGSVASPATPRVARTRAGAEVVLVMGIQGAGKTRWAAEYVARGYLRLNRDERGGKLRGLAGALDEALASGGAQRVVLDNTYLTRTARSYVVEVARRHGVAARCVWLDVPLAQAQVNLVERMLERYGELLAPEDLRRLSRGDPGLLLPTAQMRALRELEPPSLEEGFAAVERVPFTRSPRPTQMAAAVFVAASALRASELEPTDREAPHLIFDWSPGGAPDSLAPLVETLQTRATGAVEGVHCPHGGGPPSCWCRPPLPGLPLAFARRHGADPARSILIGTGPAHRTLAAALGARYVEAMNSPASAGP